MMGVAHHTGEIISKIQCFNRLGQYDASLSASQATGLGTTLDLLCDKTRQHNVQSSRGRGAGGTSYLLVTATTHDPGVRDWNRISHIAIIGVRCDVGILRMREGLTLIVVVWATHLCNRWRQRRAHVVLTRLLLLHGIQRSHAWK